MEYRSNANAVLLNLENRLKKASDVSALQRTIGAFLFASNLRRIHTNGLDVGMKRIGAYSVKPIYVNPKNSPKSFEPMGKTGKVFFKTEKGLRKSLQLAGSVVKGRMHQTRYFKAGYFGFRATIGRDVSVVNLNLSGKLRLDWAMEQSGKNWIIGFRSKYGHQVAQGNEIHFGRQIWGISNQDRKDIKEIEQEFITKSLAKT